MTKDNRPLPLIIEELPVTAAREDSAEERRKREKATESKGKVTLSPEATEAIRRGLQEFFNNLDQIMDQAAQKRAPINSSKNCRFPQPPSA